MSESIDQRIDLSSPAEQPAVLRDKPSFAAARRMKRQLLAELGASRREGNPIRPEDLLPRWPTESRGDPDVASLLFEDYHQRRSFGEKPSQEEYSQRFPEHVDSMANLFRHQEFLHSVSGDSDGSSPSLALPTIGDELYGFLLRHELGRGAFARVFLAEQAGLAGRPVVLKISNAEGHEPQTLAQLQHTHIVPIYSVHEDAQAGLRAVCMPNFGGASLSRILQRAWEGRASPTQGQQLVEALEAVEAPSLEMARKRNREREGAEAPPEYQASTPTSLTSVCSSAGQTPKSQLSGMNYIRASAWIVARLAEALQHAHQRGVLHRDIKPSNVLLGADGTPLLLDFNLAHHVNGDQVKTEATLGGTVAYMAPEHLRAFNARNSGKTQQVDQRSDIYSTGMVLYEMLTGHNPFDQSGSYSPMPVLIEAMAVERGKTIPSIRQRRGDVPWSLESIACKCMSPDPAERYQEAEHLAEDLRRFLDDRGLKYAPELSRTEQAQKWIRRHPRVTYAGSVATVASLLLVTVGSALVGTRASLATTQEQLGVVQTRDRTRAYADGTVRALCLVHTASDAVDYHRRGLAECEATLAIFGIFDKDNWQEDPEWQRLDPEERLALAEDTRELLLSLAWARVRPAPHDAETLREALALLDRAESIRGLKPSPALWHDREYYLTQLGETERASAAREMAGQIQPSSAHDHYSLATTYIRNGGPGRHAKALEELNTALRLNPRHYWSHAQKGICHQELGDYTLAADEFGRCVGLAPDFAFGYFNSGFVLDQSGKKAEAIEAYTAALERDASFFPAHINRGLALLELTQYRPALADFDRAIQLGCDDASVHAGRGVALEGLRRHAMADKAFDEAFARAAAASEKVRNRIRWVYGFAVSLRLPEKAREAFEEVLRSNPHHPEGLYGRALILVQRGHEPEAIRELTHALQVAPLFVQARRHLAILWARQGAFDDAVKDINWCLEKEPKGGATLYAAACVTSLAAEKAPDKAAAKQAADQALRWLESAFAQGYGRDKGAKDRDLAGIRHRPEFQLLLSNSEQQARNPN